MKLEFRAPADLEPTTASELLGRAWPGATPGQLEQAFSQKNVRIDGRVSRNPQKIIEHDALISAEVGEAAAPLLFGDAPELGRGQGWVVVEKPVGVSGTIDREDPLNPVLSFADTLGVAREDFSPVWPMPLAGGGPWLFGLSETAARTLFDAWLGGALMITWVALVPTPPRPQGRLVGPEGVAVDYSATQIREGVAEVQLTPRFGAQTQQDATKELLQQPIQWLLELLAAHKMPVLGDARRGGYMVRGALRLRVAAFYYVGGDASSSSQQPDEVATQVGHDLAHSWNPGADWWPDGPVVWEDAAQDKVEQGDLSRAEGREFIDPQTRRGRALARSGRGEGDDEIDILVDEAIARRAQLIRTSQRTDLFRLIHGKADGLPGFYLDRIGPLMRATIMEAGARAFSEQVYQNILDFDPEMMILEVEHLRDIRAENASVTEDRQARVVDPDAQFIRAGERVIGAEDGLKFWCEPWEGIDVGFFADQRENRRKLRQMIAQDARPNARWLNLFCHTGAFSVALASVGCEVVSVDLSKRYLSWLEDNLVLNQLSVERNISIADDARAFLNGYSSLNREPFDGIIVDPPTAARSSAGFWSVKKDYEDLLVRCFERLASRGVMLVCRNDKRPADRLESVVRRAAKRAGRAPISLQDAPPALDYPRLAGFPEGDSFEGLWVRASD